MSVPTGEDGRKIARELIDTWRAAGNLSMAPRESPYVGLVVYALASHAINLADAALTLIESERPVEAAALIRQVVETVWTAVWVEAYGAPAARALVHEQTRSTRNTMEAFVKAETTATEEDLAEVRAALDELRCGQPQRAGGRLRRGAKTSRVGCVSTRSTARLASSPTRALWPWIPTPSQPRGQSGHRSGWPRRHGRRPTMLMSGSTSRR